MILSLSLLVKMGGAIFLAGGAWWRLQGLEKRLASDIGEVRADLRAVHERINSEVARSVVVPITRAVER